MIHLFHSLHSVDFPKHVLHAEHFSKHREYGRDQERQGSCPLGTYIPVRELLQCVFEQNFRLKYQFTDLLQLLINLLMINFMRDQVT